MATPTTGIKHKPLTISEKSNIRSKVAYDCPSVPTCSEAMEYLEKYKCFLRSNTDVPEHTVQSIWNLKMFLKKEQDKAHLTNISGKVNIWNEMLTCE
jgi:hypothetical protein